MPRRIGGFGVLKLNSAFRMCIWVVAFEMDISCELNNQSWSDQHEILNNFLRILIPLQLWLEEMIGNVRVQGLGERWIRYRIDLLNLDAEISGVVSSERTVREMMIIIIIKRRERMRRKKKKTVYSTVCYLLLYNKLPRFSNFKQQTLTILKPLWVSFGVSRGCSQGLGQRYGLIRRPN